ncbi:hypothetical protein K2Z83_27605 [Oscillochloris sp. ZM17-4]|uniref:hypothetical protein n=1 Tax=Oscillochloris sp. ZM17-4 TaxID=2866714 RepID=UPI001C731670|nr:hypothetical protein [Oscillochloris sp. ZM17-4]MBX0331423.1 hypothetical protein [Oscillochloris sp. ZM17-4]
MSHISLPVMRSFPYHIGRCIVADKVQAAAISRKEERGTSREDSNDFMQIADIIYALEAAEGEE